MNEAQQNEALRRIHRDQPNGVVTLFGYGITVRIDRGHLLVQDGIGADRCQIRLPRVGHGLRRLIVIGSDGMVSLAALRWLADQDAAFVMLDRDGTVLATTGPVRPSDARLRRAQALAHETGASLRIARELISKKVGGQERLVREKLHDATAANSIAEFRAALSTAETLDAVRLLESQAASSYWSAWRRLPITYPKKDMPRVPEHWQFFGTRKSVLSGSPRLATNPANAMLNYLYALLESESRLAAAAMGLDPGIGVLHVDTPARDSLACDLMEPIRPQVDGYVLDWITAQPLKREWFLEQRDGTCRLMSSFAVELSRTAPIWGRAVAPFAEWITHALWLKAFVPIHRTVFPTRLTQRHKREAKGSSFALLPDPTPSLRRLCHVCGAALKYGQTACAKCAVTFAAARMVNVARLGRIAGQSPDAQARRSETQRRHHSARRDWRVTQAPVCLDKQAYVSTIQPRLVQLGTSIIASSLGVSKVYAGKIRQGKCVPHPRHWKPLAQLLDPPKDARI